MNDVTLEYYEKNAEEFSASTIDVDFSSIQERFLKKLPEHASILDLGCGSGRDSKYFLERGYRVTAVDGSEKLCKKASIVTGIPVKQMFFQDLDEINRYEGIWACSSILHLSSEELTGVLKRIYKALKNEGVFYTSFKYGTFKGMRNGRYFTDQTETSFMEMIRGMEEWFVEEYWITGDVRPGRGDERWLNLLLRKKS